MLNNSKNQTGLAHAIILIDALRLFCQYSPVSYPNLLTVPQAPRYFLSADAAYCG